MRAYWATAILLAASLLAMFLIVEQSAPGFLTDPEDIMDVGGIGAAVTGVGLLIADVVLPVPSSLIMIANGALFGVLVGTALSTVGSIGAAGVGFWIGRRGGPVLARFVPTLDQAKVDRLLDRWGALALIVTRPVPLLAETTAIMAGASSFGWKPAIVAMAAGSLPVAVLYAVTGATAASLGNAFLSFGLVIAVAGLFWTLRQRIYSRVVL